MANVVAKKSARFMALGVTVAGSVACGSVIQRVATRAGACFGFLLPILCLTSAAQAQKLVALAVGNSTLIILNREGTHMADDKKGSSQRVSDKWNRTLRLTFSYEGSTVRLVSSQSIEMTPPPAEPEPIKEGQAGFWYELVDPDGRQLYQRVVHNPIRVEDEIYSSEPNAAILRKKIEVPHGSFELLVPNVPGAHSVILFSSPLEPAESGRPAVELARFRLTDNP